MKRESSQIRMRKAVFFQSGYRFRHPSLVCLSSLMANRISNISFLLTIHICRPSRPSENYKTAKFGKIHISGPAFMTQSNGKHSCWGVIHKSVDNSCWNCNFYSKVSGTFWKKWVPIFVLIFVYFTDQNFDNSASSENNS